MTRLFLAAWALLMFPPSSDAGETLVRLEVRPMAAPRPVLRYQLLPELDELKPGNPAQNYLKCFMEQHTLFYSTKAVADRTRYQTMPLADLPVGELRHYGGYALRQADWAARLDTLDWAAFERVQRGGIEALPGELGPLQVLASALHVRLRAEVAGKDVDDALRTIKTMLALSRHLGEYPAELATLIGLSTASLTLGTLEEMIRLPGCPNLYWALTDLPSPLVDVRTGLHGQRMIATAELRPLRDDGPMTETDLDAFVSRLSGLASFAREQAGRPPGNLRTVLQAMAHDAEQVRMARRRLVEAGRTQDQTNTLPPLQAILLDEKREYELVRDERLKLVALPLWQIGLTAGGNEPGQITQGIFADLLPDVIGLRLAQGQLQQHIALLRHVEALRFYAAEHDGALPQELCEFTDPLPADPLTGKPFTYAVEGRTVHVTGGSIRIGDRGPGKSLHYVVTVPNEAKRRP